MPEQNWYIFGPGVINAIAVEQRARSSLEVTPESQHSGIPTLNKQPIQ